MWKKTLKIFLALLLLVAVERFCYKQTAGFRIQKISTLLPHREEWEVGDNEVPTALLEQPYTFLGSGVQCYAFESADKKTVLKVFKHYHSVPSNDLLKNLSLPHFLENYRQQLLQKRYRRLFAIFDSCKIAYEDLREQTGLVYLHLNRTHHLNKKLTLIDKIGNAHTIDLDTTAFLLQKKGELIFTKLSSFLKNGNTESAKHLIHSLVSIIAERTAKGIANTDPIIRRNFGYFENQAIEIDTGSFTKNPRLRTKQERNLEILWEVEELEQWLEKNSPQLIPFFQDEVRAHLL